MDLIVLNRKYQIQLTIKFQILFFGTLITNKILKDKCSEFSALFALKPHWKIFISTIMKFVNIIRVDIASLNGFLGRFEISSRYRSHGAAAKVHGQHSTILQLCGHGFESQEIPPNLKKNLKTFPSWKWNIGKKFIFRFFPEKLGRFSSSFRQVFGGKLVRKSSRNRQIFGGKLGKTLNKIATFSAINLAKKWKKF